jgi:hypothetical protein
MQTNPHPTRHAIGIILGTFAIVALLLTTNLTQAQSGSMVYLPLIMRSESAGGSGLYSLRFYGYGDNDIDRVKIRIDNPAVPADVGGNFTFEFWMKANLADNDSWPANCGGFNWIYGNIIFDRDILGSGDYGDYGISLHNGRIRFGAGNGNGENTICGSTNVANGVWHHIAITRNSSGNGQMRIYVDGVQDASDMGPTGDMSYGDGQSGAPDDPFLVIGAEKHDIDNNQYPSYNGYLDEVRLSNIVRYTSTFTPPSAPFATDGNTVALYHFNEGPLGKCTNGATVIDSSGAPGGPSHGICRSGSQPPGPQYSTDTPF